MNNNFNVSIAFDTSSHKIEIDDVHDLWRVKPDFGSWEIYRYANLLKVELEEAQPVNSKDNSANSVVVRVVVNDLFPHTIDIECLGSKASKDSSAYREASDLAESLMEAFRYMLAKVPESERVSAAEIDSNAYVSLETSHNKLKTGIISSCIILSVLLLAGCAIFFYKALNPHSPEPSPTPDAATPAPVAAPLLTPKPAASPSVTPDFTPNLSPTPDLLQAGRWGVVINTQSPVNVRKRPNSDSDIIGRVRIGDRLQILDDSAGGWYKVDLSGKEGYIYHQYFEAIDDGD